jgi:hypothetical protein
VPLSERGEAGAALQGKLGAFAPIVLEPVQTQPQRLLFRELVGRHHYLGHAVPFGAHLRYLFYSGEQVLGAMQFSSPAWRLAARAPVEEDESAMAQDAFAQLIEFLRSPHSRALSHSELEAALSERGRELLRVLFQAHVDSRGPGPTVNLFSRRRGQVGGVLCHAQVVEDEAVLPLGLSPRHGFALNRWS